jgi:hypothetical protein
MFASRGFFAATGSGLRPRRKMSVIVYMLTLSVSRKEFRWRFGKTEEILKICLLFLATVSFGAW